MQKGHGKLLKFVIVLVIAGAFVWFLILSPMIQFHKNEKTLEDAARRYFELNSSQLPTGERVKTLSLNTLYKGSYLKEDFKIPYSSELCSLEKSWVKVRRENGEYQYYVYLDCGMMSSSIDHKGPTIQLNGKEEMTVELGEKFKDPGVSSVVDDRDGKMDDKTVTVKGKVDTSKPGTYELTYSASDSLSNKTIVKREVKVVKVLKSMVKADLGKEKNYKGNPENNYVRLSNMLFRIFGLDDDGNVILVSDQDISNVNFTKIDQWLEEVYMTHLTEEAKKLLVKSKFCNMKVNENNLDTTKCTSYSEKKYVSIPSVVDVNLAETDDGGNFMKPSTMSWISNPKNGKEAYVTRSYFYDDAFGQNFYLDDATYNYGVRPKLVMKGGTLITGGNGTRSNPYTFGETKKAKGGSNLNTRYPGEYITSNGYLWRIMEVMDDGTIKVISDDTLGTLDDRPMAYSYRGGRSINYDTKNKTSHAYVINNKSSEYIDVSIFSTHEIKIPVYKKKIVYGEASKYNTLKVKLTAPSMYDMFSAQTFASGYSAHSYWLCDTAPNAERVAGAITDIGVPVNQMIPYYEQFGIRVVGFLKKNTVISSGKGTFESPYKLK